MNGGWRECSGYKDWLIFYGSSLDLKNLRQDNNSKCPLDFWKIEIFVTLIRSPVVKMTFRESTVFSILWTLRKLVTMTEACGMVFKSLGSGVKQTSFTLHWAFWE